MENQLNISEELRSISAAVAAIERKNTYSVPEDYFSLLPDLILSLVKEEVKPEFSAVTPYTVPVNYFESFADSVLNKIRSQENPVEEIETLSPLLASLKHKETYQVPAGYFEKSFDAPIEQPAAKVFRMQPRTGTWKRYAVAASVAVILAVTGMFTFNAVKSNKETASVNINSVEEKMSVVTDAELQDYIFEATDYPLLSSEGEPEVESAISTLADNDINDYLKENSYPDTSPVKGI